MLSRENFDDLHVWDKRRTVPQDTQKGHSLRTVFVKRRSSLVAELAAPCSRDTLHASRFTGVENAASGLSRYGG
jgi:hypothetical protein